MTERRMAELLLAAAHETREDVSRTAWRFVGRVSELAAHTTGALAGQVDEWGGRLSERLDELVATAAIRTGDRLVALGERLSGSAEPTRLPEASEI